MKKPIHSPGWIRGTALPHYHAALAEFEARWKRKLAPSARFFAYGVILTAIDPSLLRLAVNALDGTPTPAAPAAPGVIDKRPLFDEVDADGNDLRTPPAHRAKCVAQSHSDEPDFILEIMPQIRALWLAGTAEQRWQNPKRKDFARDLRAAGGVSKRGILLGVLDSADADDGRDDILAAAELQAPGAGFTFGDVDAAKNAHRKRKPYPKPPTRKAN